MHCICNPHAEAGPVDRLPGCPVHGVRADAAQKRRALAERLLDRVARSIMSGNPADWDRENTLRDIERVLAEQEER